MLGCTSSMGFHAKFENASTADFDVSDVQSTVPYISAIHTYLREVDDDHVGR